MPRASRPTQGKSLYSVHPGIAMIQKRIADLSAKSGRSMDEWVRLVKAKGPATEKERRVWLKNAHGLGTIMATWIAERAEGKNLEEGDPEAYLKAAPGYVETMYAGGKAGLRPVHDALVELARALGDDVRVCPCQTIVPLYRHHVFAQIKPTTRTRLDFGLALQDTPATGRLIDTGGFAKKDRITHRIPLAAVADIDDEVRHWLKVAYDRDA